MEPFQFRTVAAAAALLALAAALGAQEAPAPGEGGEGREGATVGWSAALTTDYVFRGASQSDGEPAAQGGVDVDLGRGLYAGLWTSTVDFGPGGPGLELDATVGWVATPVEGLAVDLALVRYAFIGEQAGYGPLDYAEVVAVVAWADTLSLTVAATDDVYATGEPGLYLALAGAWEIGRGLTLDVSAGRSRYAAAAGYRDYHDGSITFGRTLGAVHAALAYHTSDGAGRDNFGGAARGRVVLTLTIAR